MQACLAWWNVVSPFGGFGSTAALAFVLIVAAVKAIFEDKKRHQEDHRTNKSTAHIVHADGKFMKHCNHRCSLRCSCVKMLVICCHCANTSTDMSLVWLCRAVSVVKNNR